MLTITKAGFWSLVLVSVGTLSALIGLPVTCLVLFSGGWGLGHGWPILVFSIRCPFSEFAPCVAGIDG
jgi:hypothetical protein